ncbi:MAG: pyrroloquinoline quinone-dependent dehydrogenase [Halioglobus sp.]|nr:pyrroloquinoline quinone-dependent dehydrogenase [Halioglobus sp.]
MFARITQWVFVGVLLCTGIALVLLGGYLVYLGGSAYYIAAGLVTLLIVFNLVRKRAEAPRLYAALLGVTVVWSVYEAELDFLALLPRLAFWMVLGCWFFTPLYRNSLNRGTSIRWLLIPQLAAVGVLLVAALQGYSVQTTGTDRATVDRAPVTDWRHYGNTEGGTRFAELDQINLDNVHQLREVWRYRTGVEHDFKMTPLQVGEMLYLCGANNVLIALDAGSGEEIWRHDPQAVPPAEHQYARTCRGISYVETPTGHGSDCEQRIVTGTVDARLVAVDAMTGERCGGFGEDGEVDLRQGMGNHTPDKYYLTSPPLVAGNRLVVGGLVEDSQNLGLPSGVVRAYDASTGEFAWAWDLGRPGDHGEPARGSEYTPGTPNVWSIMSYDPELGLIYAPTGNAAPDYFGGARRRFDDEWSSAVVAIDVNTGEPRWKYQTVHHDIWDYDVPAQPVLVDVEHDGERIPSVAVPTKMGEVFLLDRRDGTPVHAIEERSVPQDPAQGEYLSPTQPFSPLPHFHPYRYEKDMWGLTPLDQLLCRVEYKMMRYEGMYTPPTVAGTFQFPANFGGFNWGSVSVDADNGLLVAAPMMLGSRLMLVSPERVAEAGALAAKLLGADHPAVRMSPDDPMPLMGEPDPENPYDHRRIKYYGLVMPFMSRAGTQVPCFEPPWSRLAVIDLNTKEILWSRPVGSMKNSGPFNTQSGVDWWQVGTPIRAGTLTTRGGLIFLSSTMDSTVRAFDLRDGAVKWSADLPGSGQATPMTYISGGRQTVIVTVPNPSWRYPRDPSTGTYTDSKNTRDGKGGYVIAYALPGA